MHDRREKERDKLPTRGQRMVKTNFLPRLRAEGDGTCDEEKKKE